MLNTPIPCAYQIPPIIGLYNASKIYAGSSTKIIHDFHVEIAIGSIVSILGPSGCGKSTFLRSLAGIEPLTGGERKLFPHYIPSAFVDGIQIGYASQTPALVPWKNTAANIALPLALGRNSPDRIADAVATILEEVGLGHAAALYPDQLSGGMKTRVALARELIKWPHLLLLDEPFTALDDIARHEMNDLLLDRARAAGITVVLVTHSAEEAAYLSDRVLVLSRDGRLARDFEIERSAPRKRFNREHSKLAARLSDSLGSTNRGVYP